MDNQQAKTRDSRLEWLAGFVDGEGSFNIHQVRCGKNGDHGYHPWFTLGGTHPATLEYVKSILDEWEIACHISWSQDKRTNRRALWRIQITGLKRVERWLQVITPHLFTKYEQAALLLQFTELRLANPGWRRGLSEEEKALVPQLIMMNRRMPHRLHANTA